MGANSLLYRRHRHRRQRDAADRLQPARRAECRPSFHYSFNLPAGACPRCEGMGSVTDIDLTRLYDENKPLAEGAITIPGYKADGWAVRIYSESGFLDPDKLIRDYTKTELHDFLHREPTR